MRPNQPIPGDGNANLFTCFRVQSDSISSGSAPWLLLLVKAVKAFVQKKKCTKSATGCRVLIASGQDVVSLAATTQVSTPGEDTLESMPKLEGKNLQKPSLSLRLFQKLQWSSGRIHRCHRCDPGSIAG